jgi:hypothetical protein
MTAFKAEPVNKAKSKTLVQQEADFTAEGAPLPGKVGVAPPEWALHKSTARRHQTPPARKGPAALGKYR